MVFLGNEISDSGRFCKLKAFMVSYVESEECIQPTMGHARPSVTRNRPSPCASHGLQPAQNASIVRPGLSLSSLSHSMSIVPAHATELLLYTAMLMYNGLLRARKRHRQMTSNPSSYLIQPPSASSS